MEFVNGRTIMTRAPRTELDALAWVAERLAWERLLRRLKQEYPPTPIALTENGAAFDDTVGPDGRVHDPCRIAYLRDHLIALHRAIQAGVDVRAYFVWSLLDNFEWTFGYSKRFGLVYVDYPTQRRIVKDSGEWYAQVIARNGL